MPLHFVLLFPALLATAFCDHHVLHVTKARVYVFQAVQSPDSMQMRAIGVVDFQEVEGGGQLRVNGSLHGLAPGLHGFHVHQMGDMVALCAGMGPHFNPNGRTHGAPTDAERHVGDLGNVQADSEGNVAVDIRDTQIALNGPNSILGRGLVVHEKADDLGRGANEESKKTGNAGKRIGCGVIGVLKEQ